MVNTITLGFDAYTLEVMITQNAVFSFIGTLCLHFSYVICRADPEFSRGGGGVRRL